MTVKSDYNVVIVGAGLSGIGAAYHLQEKCPNLTFTILEARSAMGGTWDLFKYPGIRSDSDMYTFGFSFYPWKNPQAIADGPSILKYIQETAEAFQIRQKIKFNHKVVTANWSSEAKQWLLTIERADSQAALRYLSCNFLFMCSGYYDYERGYEPAFPNCDQFEGIVVHPQKWDSKLDYTNKRVIIVGSGATAVTLVPEMAKKAKMVTLLQRSPTYITNLPSKDVIAQALNKALPRNWAYTLSRWKNILFSLGFYQLSRKCPKLVKNLLKKHIRTQLGSDYEERHFNPSYKPWDQRLCVVPDNDLFLALKEGKAEMVTDTIQTFTKRGILLSSGQELEADIIVTATGLKIQLFGGMKLMVDQKVIDTAKMLAYKGVMFSGIPNFAVAVGYTNASWTLKCDLNCHYVTKVLNHMSANDYSVITPRFDYENLEIEPLLDFNAGYILRANDILPKQGSKAPWKVYQNYVKDLLSLKYGSVKDKYLEYSS